MIFLMWALTGGRTLYKVWKGRHVGDLKPEISMEVSTPHNLITIFYYMFYDRHLKIYERERISNCRFVRFSNLAKLSILKLQISKIEKFAKF